MELQPLAQRVLGSMAEKALTTPDGYPLSANALRTACNQKTARDPVVTLDDADVAAGLMELREHGLVLTKYTPGSRVPKYAHLLDEKLDFTVEQVAVVAVLLLRGPQTVGEIRTRTTRMVAFEDLSRVEAVLASLAEHKFGRWVEPVPRAPGQKEGRHRQLLGPEADPVASPGDVGPEFEELLHLRTEVEDLRAENVRLRAELDQVTRQLDELTAP